MKIAVIGASGDIGEVICATLGPRHDLVRIGRNSGDVTADMADPQSVARMFDHIGPLGSVICAAGDVHFAPLSAQTPETYADSLKRKTVGQITVVLVGMKHVTDGGCFTLTSGVLDRDPIVSGSAGAAANGAIAGFVRSAALEMPRGLRLNAVSPGVLERSASRYADWFAGHTPVPDDTLGRAYRKSVEGALTGQVFCV